jgi:hypothetical protein
MQPIRRPDDDELCGFVDERSDGWHALTVFGGPLGVHSSAVEAERAVRLEGLSSLMERWVLVDGSAAGDEADEPDEPDEPDEQIVCIQEANQHSVTLALDYYSLPGVPTMRITREELDAGRWILRPTR